MSLEIYKVAEAEPVIIVEGNMCGTVMRGAVTPLGSPSLKLGLPRCRKRLGCGMM